MKLKYQRIAVLVDVQNMFYSAKNIYNAKLDFEKLLYHVVDQRRLIRAIAYIVETPDIDQTNFISILRKIGYEVRSKPLLKRYEGKSKGDWDMGLAIDAIALSDKVDAIVLVSGDGDFSELVNMLKGRGVRVEVHSFAKSTADELKDVATEYQEIDPAFLMPFKK